MFCCTKLFAKQNFDWTKFYNRLKFALFQEHFLQQCF